MARKVIAAGVLSAALLTGTLAAVFLLSDNDNPGSTPRIIRTAEGSGANDGAPVLVTSGGIAANPNAVLLSSGVVDSSVGGLQVRASASGVVPADVAVLVALYPSRPTGPFPASPQIPAEDRAAVISALTALGVSADAITFESDYTVGPFWTVAVRLSPGEVQSKGSELLAAIERAVGRAELAGVRFALQDCAVALEPIRQEALATLRSKAQALASAASLTLGPITQLLEQSGSTPYGPPVVDPCAHSASLGKAPADIQPLDARPEVRTELQLEATFATGESSGEAILSVTGGGSVTVEANEAYILVFPAQSGGPLGPEPISFEDRNSLKARLGDLGIEEGEIEIESLAFGGPTLVSVQMSPESVSELGEKVVEAVDQTLGRSQGAGVRFGHSNCLAVLAEAQKAALEDAKNRADSLAGVGGWKVNGLWRLSESFGLPAPYAALEIDPCGQAPSRAVLQGPYEMSLKPFDSPAEFEVEASLTATFELQPQ
jgi:uncharacterized protein YggE